MSRMFTSLNNDVTSDLSNYPSKENKAMNNTGVRTANRTAPQRPKHLQRKRKRTSSLPGVLNCANALARISHSQRFLLSDYACPEEDDPCGR